MTRSLVTAALAVAMVAAGCAGPDPDPQSSPSPSPSSSSALSPAERSSVLAEVGIPPEPDADTAAAYLADLEAIEPDIVHGDPDKAIDRGRNQCSSIDGTDDEQRLVAAANMRFTSPEHPSGFGSAVAEQILRVVRRHLCPDGD